MTKEEIQEAIRNEHMKELQKYTIGELIEAIENHYGMSRYDIGRSEVVRLPKSHLGDKVEGEKYCTWGGPGIIFIIRNLDEEQRKSIESKKDMSE